MNTDEILQKQLAKVWENEILNNNARATPQQNPKGFVLGGQPGAGKSILIEKIKKELNSNVIVINGDDYRKYHPDYTKFQAQGTKDSAPKTQEFAGKMTEAIFQKAILNKYNLIIEGTFRTAQVPINTLKTLKENGYNTNVMIQICTKEISWDSCLERYEKMLKINPSEARYTPKEHHDLVIQNLAKNIKEVQNSDLVDRLQIFTRILIENKTNEFEQKLIYNSLEKAKVDMATIDRYLANDKKLSLEQDLSL